MSKARIQELRDQNSATLTAARGIRDQITEDTPAERAAELETQFNAAMAEYDQRAKRIQSEESLMAAEAAEAEAREAAARNRRPEPGAPGATNDDDAPSYRDVFRKTLQYGAAELSNEERSILQTQGRVSGKEERALATGAGATGGYLIPQDMLPEIDRALAEWGPMMDPNVSRHLNSSTGNVTTLPTLDYTAKRGEQHTEGGASTDDGSSDPAFGQKTLGAYIYKSGIVRISVEMLQDSEFDLEDLMNDLFGESLGQTCNDVLTTGDGTNKPLGILTFAGSGKTAASASAIIGDELIDLQHSVKAPYRKSPKCIWQLNDLTLAAVRKMKDGQGNYLWQEANIRAGEPAVILGKRYEVNPALPDIGAGATPIIFGDHGKYIVRKVGTPGVTVFREKYMDNLEVGFMAWRRIDGAGTREAALKKLTMAAA